MLDVPNGHGVNTARGIALQQGDLAEMSPVGSAADVDYHVDGCRKLTV